MRNLTPVRLFLVAAAGLMFLGGLLVAIGRWNRAETDRAFVEAAAMAVQAPPPASPSGIRYWAPATDGNPDLSLRMRLDAETRMRALPAAPSPATTGMPRLPQPAPAQGGGSSSSSAPDRPQAVPR
ncbi:hypothetical protein GXW77_21520 [Roseomonas alkaliterrae]|uniref:Uncharacterized protein n=1 Tax=Neoroseomonas alkaliterrae TaxID=1452450 RepID=A0A840YBC8_9PROT|nr:hypothetical protein [Neoroseomonas alkaliterrae]MBB5691263.1 hypothetical protein [Neoroseomonas alkaliterrae]MBR0678756.1 hypothetical protein [Neoroseomonas alkaliterrae]